MLTAEYRQRFGCCQFHTGGAPTFHLVTADDVRGRGPGGRVRLPDGRELGIAERLARAGSCHVTALIHCMWSPTFSFRYIDHEKASTGAEFSSKFPEHPERVLYAELIELLQRDHLGDAIRMFAQDEQERQRDKLLQACRGFIATYGKLLREHLSNLKSRLDTTRGPHR